MKTEPESHNDFYTITYNDICSAAERLRGYTYAAILTEKLRRYSSRVGTILSGGNVTQEMLREVLSCLEQAQDATCARVLITFADGTIALLRQHREYLEQRVRVALAKEAAFFVPMSYDYLDWHDLLPAGVATVDFARFALQWGGKGLLRKRTSL